MPEINIEVDFRQVTKSLDDLADAYGTRARKSVVRSAIRRTLRESVAKSAPGGYPIPAHLPRVSPSAPRTARPEGAKDAELSAGSGHLSQGGAGALSQLPGLQRVKHVGSIEHGRKARGAPGRGRKVTRGANIMERIWASDSRRWIRQFAKNLKPAMAKQIDRIRRKNALR